MTDSLLFWQKLPSTRFLRSLFLSTFPATSGPSRLQLNLTISCRSLAFIRGRLITTPTNCPLCSPYLEQTPLIGEIGLDFHFFKEPVHQAQQRTVFECCLDAAAQQQKIVNLHTLRAEREVLAQLEIFRPPTPIVHWYAGPRSLIERYLALGAYFSFGVEVLFSERLAKLLTAVPPDRPLTETDNPTAYSHFAKKPGMPSTLRQVVAKIAELRQMAEKEVVERVAGNFTRLIMPVTGRF